MLALLSPVWRAFLHSLRSNALLLFGVLLVFFCCFSAEVFWTFLIFLGSVAYPVAGALLLYMRLLRSAIGRRLIFLKQTVFDLASASAWRAPKPDRFGAEFLRPTLQMRPRFFSPSSFPPFSHHSWAERFCTLWKFAEKHRLVNTSTHHAVVLMSRPRPEIQRLEVFISVCSWLLSVFFLL